MDEHLSIAKQLVGAAAIPGEVASRLENSWKSSIENESLDDAINRALEDYARNMDLGCSQDEKESRLAILLKGCIQKI